MESENRLYTVLSVAGGMACLALSVFFGSPVAAAIAAFFFCLSLALWKAGHLIIPAIARSARIVERGPSFEIPPSQDVVVGREGGEFFATCFLSAQLYNSASEDGEQRRNETGRMFESAISSCGFPFKVCAMISPLPLKQEIEDVRAKRSIAESRLEKEGAKKGSAEAARLEREIAMWGRMLDRLSNGERPLEVLFYFSTTASGITKEEAIAGAKRQAEELSVVLSSALSCSVSRLSGSDMKRCFWWDFFGPANAEQLRDAVF